MYTVVIAEPAERDVRRNRDWWADNRSVEQADRWYTGIYRNMYSLDKNPERHPLATELSLQAAGIRQASFGLGRRPSHRILFGIAGDEVIIYRVQAFAQDAIDLDDLIP